MRTLLVLLLAFVMLQGCGLKGPLYVPTPAEKREMAERKKRLEERQEQEKQQQQQQQQQQQSAAPAGSQ